MKHIILFIACFSIIYSQNEGNNWYFGRNAGISFNSGSPVAITDGSMNQDEGCASISDAAGNLLFYTDGIRVWNKIHALMDNGGDLLGNPSATQSGVIIPFPRNPGKYFIFTVIDAGKPEGLNYSIVDIMENNGLGKVIEKNIFLHSPVTEKITAVNHRNGRDIWVITQEWESDRFLVFLITSEGLNKDPVFFKTGINFSSGFAYSGYLKASPNGIKISAAIGGTGRFLICDFDNISGIISNCVVVNLGDESSPYGIEFSPDATKLYVSSISNPSGIFQFDISNKFPEDIEASKSEIVTVGEELRYGALQLGPDGNIYCTNREKNYLSAILNPDSSANKIEFLEKSVSLENGFSVWGLPTFLQSYFFVRPDCHESAFNYDLFEPGLNLEFNGHAKVENNELFLTPSVQNIAGSCFHKDLIPVAEGFKCEFAFKTDSAKANIPEADDSEPGGDGLAFIIKGPGTNKIGNGGMWLGYGGIENSLAIEIDLYNNSGNNANRNDANGNHIAVMTRGSDTNSSFHDETTTLALASDIPVIKNDGSVYYCKIDYISDTLRVYLEESPDFISPVIQVPGFNLTDYLTLDNGTGGHIGFTAGTGLSSLRHIITYWSVCPAYSDYINFVNSEIQRKNECFAYPNPALNKICFEILNSDSGFNEIVELYTIQGEFIKSIYNLKTSDSNICVEINDIPQGIYILKTGTITELFTIIR